MNYSHQKHIVVVLGMHRSGTSAVTRGLQVMGVELGDRLLPAKGDNQRGFWEDADINAINIDMLQAVASDWHHLAAISRNDLEILRHQGYLHRAAALLEQKASGRPPFGFKDPRVAKLLPFWKEVFRHFQFDVSYVLSVRHPLSVVQSLAKRDGFDAEKSYLLWLGHVITSLSGTVGDRRVLVDYDRLVQSPDCELERMARGTGLEIDLAELQSYKTQFLDQALRHTVYTLDDLLGDDLCPPVIREVYTALLEVATDRTRLADVELQSKVEHWSEEFVRLKSPLLLIDRLYTQQAIVAQTLVERDGQIARLQQSIAELNQAVALRDQQITEIKDSLSWKITALFRAAAGVASGIASRVFTEVAGAKDLFPPHLVRLVRDPRWWLSTSAEAASVMRTSGWTGLKQTFAHKIRQVQQLTSDYQKWIHHFDRLTEETCREIQHRIRGFADRPLISVLMPVFNPPPQFLDKAIQSVRQQIYPYWELCIADDASTHPAVREILERHREQDNRIKVIYREENGHISRASNSALELVSGDFVALMDHDDLLAEHALFWIANAINEQPDAALIYSDEDKIQESGSRYDPYFKCEFNYELLLAQNMVSHLGVYRTSLVRELGGFRPGVEGAQDWDLVLRMIEQVRPDQVIHVPRILYHWRAIMGSTAFAIGEKGYAATAGRKVLREHLQRCGIAAEVLPVPEAPAFNRIRFARPNPLPPVSIIIPTRDRADLLGFCIHSILERTSYPNYEIIVMDNGSKEAATLELFERLPQERVRIERNEKPFNFSALNNQGARIARGELLCLMNNDIEIITTDWLEEMTSFAVRSDVGAVGARLWYPDGRLQHGGVIIGVGGVANHSHYGLPRGNAGYFGRAVLHQSFSAVTAACLLIRRTVFEAVGGMDEALAVAFNDVDFCLRVRQAGYRNVWTPYAEMKHHESASRGCDNTQSKQARFAREVRFVMERWGEQLLRDPAYSPNLTLVCEDFSLAWPPRVELLKQSPTVASGQM